MSLCLEKNKNTDTQKNNWTKEDKIWKLIEKWRTVHENR